MLKRLRDAFLLALLGAGLLSWAVFTGALAGIGWLEPYADALGRMMDSMSVGVIYTVIFAALGLLFIFAALRALFSRSGPKT